MRRKDYLICYDICSPKRLQKIGREMDKLAIRIQYSIFLAPSVSNEMLLDILNIIENIIDEEEDDVRIYTIVESGIRLGKAMNLNDPDIMT